jgi:hypothetical protein
MADAAVTSSHTFRIPFWRMYLPAAVYAQFLYAPGMWGAFYFLASARGASLDSRMIGPYLIGSAAVAVLLAPAFLVYVWRHRVTVTPDTFTCSNGFGGIPTVPWDSITGVKRLNVPGFPYLLVTSTKTRLKLWLPLFLGRFEEFTEKVEEYAGVDHPLYRALPVRG